MCPNCRAFITTKDNVCPYCGEKVGPRAIDMRNAGEMLLGFIPSARFVTVLIVLIDLALYAGQYYGGPALIQAGADSGLLVFRFHQWYRLVTGGFLHGNLLHILMNLWVLFDLGAQVEELYGPPRYIVFFSLANAFGLFCSAYLKPAIPAVGSSAGIFGLIGAMIALGVRNRGPMGQAIRGMYIRWAIYGLLFGLLPGIDNTAHVGGLIAGFATAYVAGTPGRIGSNQESFWRLGAVICVAVTAFCFLQLYLHIRMMAQ